MAIVCGTDLSERSRPAIAAAAAIASATRAPLWVAHAVGESAALLDPAAREQLGAAVRERLEREAAPAEGGVAVHHAMLEGSPHDALLSLARERDATLLVVSSKGHGGSPRYRLGGTSERIALDAPLPLLVVRDAGPFDRWARRDQALRVVVGVDSTASAAPAVRFARTLAAAGPCDVVFVHVFDDPEARERYGLSDDAPAAELEALLERDVTAAVGPFPGLGSHTVRVHGGAGRYAETLLEIASEERADLVVLGTHHRRGPARLWSVSSAVLHGAACAVAIVPTAAAGVEPELPGRIRTALVATDLSPQSNAGLPFAFSLVDRGGEVHVLHVLPPRERSEERERQDATVAEQLRRLVPPGLARRGISAQVHVAHGEATGAICDLAERLGVEIVCVTSRRRGLARVMGSIVSELLEASRKPVLVIHPPPP